MKKRLCSLLAALFVLASFSAFPAVAEETPSAPLADDYCFYADFDDLETGTYTDAEIQSAAGIPMAFTKIGSQSVVDAKVIEESDGNKFMKLSTNKQGDAIDSLYTLDAPISVGKIEAGYEFKPADTGSGRWHMFMLYNEDGTSANSISWSNVIVKTSDSVEGTVHKQQPLRNAKNRISFRYEISRGSSNEDWVVNIYDVSQQEPSLIYSRTIPKTFGAIKQIKPIRYYGGNGGWPAEFDNYYVKTITYSEVVDGSETVALGSNVEKFALTFNEQLKKPDDKVTLVNTTNENVEPIETKTIYNAETKKLEIMPKSLLDYSTTYRVVFENGGVASYSFTTTAAPISITPGSVTYSNESGTLAEIPISGTFSASYTVTAASSVADKHLVVILIAYNSQGVAVAFDVQSQPLTPPSVSNVTATLNNLKGGEITEVKALIHEYKDGIGFKPIK